MVLARFPNDALDYPGNFLTHRLLADRIRLANLAAARLRRGNLLPAGVQKHFEVKPVQTRPDCTTTTVTSIMPAKPTPAVDASVPPSEMRRCSLLELDNGQCRWPLGDVHQVMAQFCGDAAVPGSPYCGHHLRMARYDRGLPQSE
jgi:hypothetical protein